MLQRRALSTLLLLSSPLLGALSSFEEHELKFGTHGISFLIDETEVYHPNDSIPTVTETLYIQLLQQACAIVASATVVRNLALFCNSPNYKQYAPEQLRVRSDLWIKKRINSDIYLLVPKKLIPELEHYRSTRHLRDDEPLTIAEKACGLKIDHAHTVNDTDFMNPSYHQHNDQRSLSENFMRALWSDKKSALFVTNNEYIAASGDTLLPTWIIFWEGHGSDYQVQGKTIAGVRRAGIAEQYIEPALQFFSRKIRTALLFMESCYAGGANLVELQKKFAANPQFKTLNYLFVSGTVFNAPQGTSNMYTIDTFLEARRKNKIYGSLYREFDASGYSTPRFDTFFSSLEQLPPIDIRAAIAHIYKQLDQQFGDGTYANLLTYIAPGQEMARLLDINDDVVQIHRTLARARDPNQPLHISSFFGGTQRKIYPRAIALFSPEVPFELVYELDPEKNVVQPPALLSLMHGNQLHKLHSIDASPFTLSQVIASFFKVQKLQENKLFSIGKIKVINDISSKGLPPVGSVMTIHNVIAANRRSRKEPDRRFFFDYNNSAWQLKFGVDQSIQPDPKAAARDSFVTSLATTMEQQGLNRLPKNSLFRADLSELKKMVAQQAERRARGELPTEPTSTSSSTTSSTIPQSTQNTVYNFAHALGDLATHHRPVPRIETVQKPTPTPPKKPTDLFAAINQNTLPIIVDVGASWCGACKNFTPTFKKLEHELGNRYAFFEIDADTEKFHEFLNQNNVEFLPTFLFIKNKKVVGNESGFKTEQEFRALIKHYFG